MGFIKFDILGLSTLKMIEGAVYHILKKQGNPDPTFEDIKKFYDKNLHPESINLKDRKVYENIFWKGKWAGIFQFAEKEHRTFVREQSQRTLLISLP